MHNDRASLGGAYRTVDPILDPTKPQSRHLEWRLGPPAGECHPVDTAPGRSDFRAL